jgi:hypothetical protein
MALLPKIKVKSLVSFPAAVYGGAGIAVRKENGNFYFDLDFSQYPSVASIPSADLPNTNVLTFNVASKAYLLAPYGGGGGSTILPATALPLVESGAGAVGTSVKYAREDHVHPVYGGGSAANMPTAIQGKLTLTSGVPVTETDVVGATVIYFTPSGGNGVSIYDGAQWNVRAVSELVLPLDNNAAHAGYHQASGNFDLFVIDTGTVRLATGPTWVTGGGSDIARGTGTALETFAGVLVNKNAITARFGLNSGDTVSVPARSATYVGSFRATADGQATDSKAKRLLFNAYNASERVLFIPGPATHDYSTATPRVINNDLANRIDVLLGLTGTMAHLEATNTIGNSTATYRAPANGINLNATTVSFGKWIGVSSASFACLDCFYDGYPGIGFQSFYWIEVGAGADTQSWYQTGSVMAGSIAL